MNCNVGTEAVADWLVVAGWPADLPALLPWPRLPGVYFAAAAERIKIGRSRSVASRLVELQVACPAPIQLLAVARGVHLETAWHGKHIGSHSHGEWFHPSRSLLDDIILLRRLMAAQPTRTA